MAGDARALPRIELLDVLIGAPPKGRLRLLRRFPPDGERKGSIVDDDKLLSAQHRFVTKLRRRTDSMLVVDWRGQRCEQFAIGTVYRTW